jgi:ABC-type polysaccharide/polyol phosphate transport system ATPase subunit
MATGDIAISLKNISKKFMLSRGGTKTLKGTVLDMLGKGGPRTEEFWALKDVNFSVRKGETLGIIGVNGAGKSTLLSIIAGTMHPTTGTVETQGTISSLLELGAGFHPDMSGRENVYLFGSIMGISQEQIESKFDAIVEFAELNRFIDQPVKHYSSGMYVRLGFSVAVQVNPDILLVDEVLAVGDAAFQRKCIARMEEFRMSGKTMLIISHDLKTIQAVSDRIILLDSGTILGDGEPESVVEQYEDMSRERHIESLRKEWGTKEARITAYEISNSAGIKTDSFKAGDSLIATLDYDSDIAIHNPVFGFAINDNQGGLLTGNNSQIEHCTLPDIQGKGRVRLTIPQLNLATGSYLLSFSLHSADHKSNYHRIENVFPIHVACDKGYDGIYIKGTWEKA